MKTWRKLKDLSGMYNYLNPPKHGRLEKFGIHYQSKSKVAIGGTEHMPTANTNNNT